VYLNRGFKLTFIFSESQGVTHLPVHLGDRILSSNCPFKFCSYNLNFNFVFAIIFVNFTDGKRQLTFSGNLSWCSRETHLFWV